MRGAPPEVIAMPPNGSGFPNIDLGIFHDKTKLLKRFFQGRQFNLGILHPDGVRSSYCRSDLFTNQRDIYFYGLTWS